MSCLQLLKVEAQGVGALGEMLCLVLPPTPRAAKSEQRRGFPSYLQLCPPVSNHQSETGSRCLQLSPLPLGEETRRQLHAGVSR